MPTTFDQLELRKAELVSGILSWSPGQLAFRPNADAWNVPQVIDHLAKIERSITAAVRTNLSAPRPLTLRDRLGTTFLHHVFASDRRVKVPLAASAVLPDPEPSLEAALLRWDQDRRELGALLAELEPRRPTAGVFRHPIGGWMNLDGVLDFFAVHIDHHKFQLTRLREAYLATKQR